MITVEYSGRLGNQLFQLAAGQIIAHLRCDRLIAPPIPGFVATCDSEYPKKFARKDLRILEGHKFHFNEIQRAESQRDYHLKGLFQNYSNIQPFKELARSKWIVPIRQNSPVPTKESLVLHIRRGDYVRYRWATPFSFYEKAISMFAFDQLIIVTDHPDDPFFSRFSRYRARIYKALPLEHFWFLVNANQLIISQSSFSWWASFLSKAEKIITPMPKGGLWSSPGVNLEVYDEARFIYLDHTDNDKPTTSEQAYHAWFMARHFFNQGTLLRTFLRYSPNWASKSARRFFPNIDRISRTTFQ